MCRPWSSLPTPGGVTSTTRRYSSDAYLKFIEDDFLGGSRLNPATDGRPDPRPDVRENEPILGNLAEDFNFSQVPRPPLLLPTNPPTDSRTIPAYFIGRAACQGCTKVLSGQPDAAGPQESQRPALRRIAAHAGLAGRQRPRTCVRPTRPIVDVRAGLRTKALGRPSASLPADATSATA